MSALRPLFAAAGVLLLIALVFLAVRSGDDTAVPTAGGTISPTDEATGPAPGDSTSRPSDDNTGTDDTTGTDETAGGTDDTTGTTGTADTTGTEDPDATDGGETTGTDGSRPSDDTACGIACGDEGDTDATTDTGTTDTGTTDTGTTDTGTTDTGTTTTDTGTTTTDTGTATTTGTGNVSIDDMPDTGGGVASILGGLVALGASAGFARRR